MNALEAQLMRHPLYVTSRLVRAAANVALWLFLVAVLALRIADKESDIAEVAVWTGLFAIVFAVPLYASAWSLSRTAARAVDAEAEARRSTNHEPEHAL